MSLLTRIPPTILPFRAEFPHETKALIPSAKPVRHAEAPDRGYHTDRSEAPDSGTSLDREQPDAGVDRGEWASDS